MWTRTTEIYGRSGLNGHANAPRSTVSPPYRGLYTTALPGLVLSNPVRSAIPGQRSTADRSTQRSSCSVSSMAANPLVLLVHQYRGGDLPLEGRADLGINRRQGQPQECCGVNHQTCGRFEPCCAHECTQLSRQSSPPRTIHTQLYPDSVCQT